MEIKIKVFAGSSKAKVLKEKDRLLVYVKSDKTKNLANKEAISLVAKHLNLKAEDVILKRGQRSENKVLGVGVK